MARKKISEGNVYPMPIDPTVSTLRRRAREGKGEKVEIETITVTVEQSELRAISRLRAQEERLKKLLKDVQAKLAPAETIAIQKLQTKDAAVEEGPFKAALATEPGKCSPKWKEEAILLAVEAGKIPGQYELDVKKKYPPKDVTSLVISKA